MRSTVVCLCALCLVQWAGWSAQSGEKPISGDTAGASQDSESLGPATDTGVSNNEGAKSQDISEIRKAAELGDAKAQCKLGGRYHNGEGVSKDDVEAIKWFRKAAEQGLASAQCSLGICYNNGQGVAQDPKEAVTWFRKAAEQGLAPAQCSLGICYENGRGVTQDIKEAAKWYRKAADQGDATAQFELGICCVGGRGVKKEMVDAYKWFDLAGQTLEEARMDRDRITAKMTRKQITQARKRSREWKPKKQDTNRIGLRKTSAEQ